MNKSDDTAKNYRKLYLHYGPMLIRFAAKFVSSYSAEDIVHDVFLKIWDKQVFLLPEDEVKRILYTAVRNACIDHLRRLNLEKDIIDKRALELKLDELNFFDSGEEVFMRNNLLEMVMNEVNKLPAGKQEIFQLSYIQGLKAAEIAEQLNVSVRTVENQLYRTLIYLRKQLASRFVFIFILF